MVLFLVQTFLIVSFKLCLLVTNILQSKVVLYRRPASVSLAVREIRICYKYLQRRFPNTPQIR